MEKTCSKFRKTEPNVVGIVKRNTEIIIITEQGNNVKQYLKIAKIIFKKDR